MMLLLRVLFLVTASLTMSLFFLNGHLHAEQPENHTENHTENKDNWIEFRNGGSSAVSRNLPLKWSPKQGISWQQELTGYGQSTPVIYQGRVYVASVIGNSKEESCLTCFDLQTGARKWIHRTKSASQAPSNYMVARAAPTPVVDEKGVYAFFEGGNLLALTLDGNERWKRNLATEFGPFKNHHGLGSSPTQTDKLIIVNLEHGGPSALVALDKLTGKTQWKVDRPSGKSWTSPIVVKEEGVSILIVSSAGAVTTYNASSGKQLWQLKGLEGNSVPSPTSDGKHLLVGARQPELGTASDAAKSNLCLRVNQKSHDVLWRSKKVVSYYSSPVIADGCAYFVSKIGVLSCLDVTTGKRYYQKRIGLHCWSTPLVSPGYIYFFGKNGGALVLKTGPEFQQVAKNHLWTPDDPPKPETYVESHGSRHGHGGKKPGGASRGGGMVKAMKAGDANHDGLLTKEELPKSFQKMFTRMDLNKDGKIDDKELNAMVKSFRKKREGSRGESRDPIVYGVAASNGTIVVRTGTRLFAIAGSKVASRTESDEEGKQ